MNVAVVLKSVPSLASENLPNEVVTGVSRVESSTHSSNDDSALEHLENVFKVASNEEDPIVQATELMLHFEFRQVRLSLSVAVNDNVTKPVLSFGLENLKMMCAKKTYETVVDLTLKDLTLNFIDHLAEEKQHQSIKMINSCDASRELLSVRFVDVSKQSPEFHVRHKSVMKKLDVVISSVVCDFHQEAVIDLLHLSNVINSRIEKLSSVQSNRYVTSINPENISKSQATKVLAAEGETRHIQY